MFQARFPTLLLAFLLSLAPLRALVRPPRHSKPSAPVQPAQWKKLSLRDQVAQLVIVPFTGQPLAHRSQAWKDLSKLVRKQHVGGLILVNVMQGHLVNRADPLQAAKIINDLQRQSRIPLLVGADLERGASMRFKDTTIFPHAMAFAAAGDPAAMTYEGAVTAREARAIGVNWVFFPDADVNSNPDNPIINIRAFSEDPSQVSTYVDAFLAGAASNPKYRVLTTAKHFPGHGDAATDSHLGVPLISVDRQHLNDVELAPFRAAIAHGVDSIMTAHIAVPAFGTGDLPATLAPQILTKLLRDEMGFKGLVVTDALEMGGIVKGFAAGDAAVRAIEAGADVLLMPADPVAAIDAVVAAVKQGRLTREAIAERAQRVTAAKARLGLATARLVDLKAIPKLVNQPESNARALEVAQRAVTLVRADPRVIPPPALTCFAVLRESSTGIQGQILEPEIHKRLPTRPVLLLDPSRSEADLNAAADQAGPCDAWQAFAFVSVAGYRGSVSLPGSYPAFLSHLQAGGKPVALISMGNPYLLRSFPWVNAYMTTFSTVPPSETAAVRALFGEEPIHGKMPVSITGLSRFGEGFDVNTR